MSVKVRTTPRTFRASFIGLMMSWTGKDVPSLRHNTSSGTRTVLPEPNAMWTGQSRSECLPPSVLV